jgi:hypothetical protein
MKRRIAIKKIGWTALVVFIVCRLRPGINHIRILRCSLDPNTNGFYDFAVCTLALIPLGFMHK